MNYLSTIGSQNMIHAFSTAFASLGGFQTVPQWWRKITQIGLVQIIVLANLVYQGGGNQNIVFSMIVALAFFSVIELSKLLPSEKRDV
jgi:hypothetical protein